MSFKGISYLELWQPFCSADQNHLSNFVWGIMRNNSVNYFEYGPVVQEGMFKNFLIWSSGGPLVRWSGTIYVILKEGIMEKFM